MNVKRRLEALERTLIRDPATLFFEDGTSIEISGRGDYIADLFAAAIRGERSPQIELLARSVGSEEPDGGHMLDLTRALLNGPVDT
ncbi:MAG TPA: hypothetical protein VMF91_24675 [Bryobacteraceae bacterium]|nr:hypothetical protein [Bryobacteraceae bacterium]